MKKMKLQVLASLILAMGLLLTSCGGNADLSNSELPDPPPIVKPVEEKIINPLTGLSGFCKTAIGKRPVAIMVNNLGKALPHRGLSKADIIYEVVVEGGITRLMAIFSDQDHVPYVGPVRSTRHYYTDLALPYNPIYIHFGGSPAGYERIKKTGLSHIDGMTYDKAFYQDKKRAANKGREHSFFINTEGFQSVLGKAKIATDGETSAPFSFLEKDTAPSVLDAGKVYVPFSGTANSQFDYNPSSGLYEKQRNGEKHIDGDTGEVLTFKNVLILYTDITSYNGETYRRDVKLSSGDGYYVSNGGKTAIHWEKGASKNQFTFSLSEGGKLSVNKGKTYICIVDNGAQNQTKFSNVTAE